MEETFERAALLAACSKSAILNKINVKSASTKELRELVNMHNSVQIKHLPILFSKYVSKCICSLIVQHKPSMKPWIHPESIRVCVEIDELSSINNGSAPSTPPITLIVLKNIVTGALGLSLDNLEHFFDNLQKNSLQPQQQQEESINGECENDDEEVLANLPATDKSVTDVEKPPEFRPKTFTGSIGSVFSKSQSPEVLHKPSFAREEYAVKSPAHKRTSSVAFGTVDNQHESYSDVSGNEDDNKDVDDFDKNSEKSTNTHPDLYGKRTKSSVDGSDDKLLSESEYLNARHFDSRPSSPTHSENSACSISPSQSASQCDFDTQFDIEKLPFEIDNAIGETDELDTETNGDNAYAIDQYAHGSSASNTDTGIVKISDPVTVSSLHKTAKNTQFNAFDFDDGDDADGLRYYDRNAADEYDRESNSSVGIVKILPLELKATAKPTEFMNVTKNFLDSAVIQLPDENHLDFDFD